MQSPLSALALPFCKDYECTLAMQGVNKIIMNMKITMVYLSCYETHLHQVLIQLLVMLLL